MTSKNPFKMYKSLDCETLLIKLIYFPFFTHNPILYFMFDIVYIKILLTP